MPTSRNGAVKEALLSQKMLIRRLYIHENKTRDQIRAELRKKGLDVSPSDLESILKEWRMRKNIDKPAWESLTCVLDKRKREGRESEVIYRGKRVKPATIVKETNRHRVPPRFASSSTQPQSSQPLSPGSQIAVCTPPPCSMEFDWSGDLPWQKFIDGELYGNLYKAVAGERLTQHVEDDDGVIQLDELFRLSIWTPGGSSSQVSKFAARIGALMPEAYLEENLRRAQCLLRGPRDEDFVFHCLTLLIYTFSNNIISPFSVKFEPWWKVALAIIRNSGIMNRTMDLKRITSPTINGFAENLFYAALHMMDKPCAAYEGQIVACADEDESVAIVTWLLKSGQDPNNTRLRNSSFSGHPQTPLQRAIRQNRLELVEILLKARADANIVPSIHGTSDLPLSPLEMAIEYESQDILRLLLEHGASANMDRALHLAILRSDMNSASLLLEHGANPYATYRTERGPIYENTALTVAAATGSRELQFILEFITSRYPNKTPSSLITADTFVAAAVSGASATCVCRYLLPGASVDNGHAITPLHAAIIYDNTEYFESLLPSYDLPTLTSPIPLLWLACLRGNERITRLIIENGADINGEARVSEKYRKVLHLGLDIELHSTPLGCTMHNWHDYSRWSRYGHLQDYNRWRDYRRQHNYDYKRKCNYSSCATMLIKAGATLTGSEIFVAITEMDYDLLLAVLAAGANPNTCNKEGKRPLQLILEASWARRENRKIVECLLHHQATVSQEEIVAGICCDDSSILKLLLNNGGNLLDPNRGFITPLEAAIYGGHSGRADEIRKAHPKIYDPGSICASLNSGICSIGEQLVPNRPTQDPLDIVEMTALGMAAAQGKTQMFKELLKYPSPPKVSYLPELILNDGSPFWRETRGVLGSPLALIVVFSPPNEQDAFSGFCELLERGFQPDFYTWYAIGIKGKVCYAEALLDKGHVLFEAQPGHPLLPEYDPLCESICENQTDVSKPLPKVEENVIRQYPQSIHVLSAIKYSRKSTIESLLEIGATIDGHLPDGPTPLQYAINQGELEVVKRLLDAGADVNRWNQNVKFARTPLQLAIDKGDLEMIDRLLEAGADVNAPPAPEGGATALQLAAMNGQVGLAQRMLELGADIDAPGAKVSGRTALEAAAEHGRIDMLKLLLARGACLTGPRRRQYIRSVCLTNHSVFHYTARELLIASGGWSDTDDGDLQVEMRKLREESYSTDIWLYRQWVKMAGRL